MKIVKYVGLLFFAISISSIYLKAQVSEPDFVGEAYKLKNYSSTISLDKETINNIDGVSKLSNTMNTLSVEIKGQKASTIFLTDEPINIVIRATDNSSDPLSIISVFKLKSTKKKRTILLTQDTSGTILKTGSNSKDMVNFKGKKYGTSSYIIELNNLNPGEYGIIISDPKAKAENKTIVLCFAIVQKQNKDLFTANTKTLTERWELDLAHQRGTFLPTIYKPCYLLFGNWNPNPNRLPQSENPENSYTTPKSIDEIELKFQLSFKTKVAQGIFWGYGDVWVAYTQSSHWQAYRKESSRPFRETNYEPEAILNFATNYRLLGFKGSLLGVALTHQSNGQSLPGSRSWNRVIFQAGFERKNWNIMLRPWIRLKDREDENPAMADYTGRAELMVVHNLKKHQLSIIGKHTLRFGIKNRGSLLFNWAFPIYKNLKGNIQIFQGYGESLIDYNYNGTTIGAGISIVEW